MLRPVLELVVAFSLAAPPAAGEPEAAEVDPATESSVPEPETSEAEVPEPEPEEPSSSMDEGLDEPVADEPAADEPEPPPPSVEADAAPLADEPAAATDYKRPRNAGIGLMAAGGVMMVAGAVLIPIFQLRADGYSDDRIAANQALQDQGCPAQSDSAMNPMCESLWDDVSNAKADARSATIGSQVGVAVLSVGAMSLIAGAIVFGLNARKQKRDGKTAYVIPDGFGVRGKF